MKRYTYSKKAFQIPDTILIAVFVLLPVISDAQFAGGAGKEEDPYQIETLEQFQALANPANINKNFVQIADIDASDNAPTVSLLHANNDLNEETERHAGTYRGIKEIHSASGVEENDRTNNATDYHRNLIYVEASGYALFGSINYQRRLPWYNLVAGLGTGMVLWDETFWGETSGAKTVNLFMLKQYQLNSRFWYGFGLGGILDYTGRVKPDNFYDLLYATMALKRYTPSPKDDRLYYGVGLYYVNWGLGWRIRPSIRIGFSF